MSVSDISRLATRFLARATVPGSRPVDPKSGPGEGVRGRQGFTLVEMMVVVVIIGLLATVVAINVLPSQDRAMVTKAKADIATLEQAIETYRLDNLDFPADLRRLCPPPATGSVGPAVPVPPPEYAWRPVRRLLLWCRQERGWRGQ